ncbi:hypothetical protein BKE38_04535 [Pseudoroseomonas deserti]|uniref:Uncharacterized protein n=1 Tax=Teichococcus deserti TaxID=1817963 RepID=A0A1V2H6X8_9PROT|nr:hypothetical protein BKE38_04535 [Pseudoroseomonas deserti]
MRARPPRKNFRARLSPAAARRRQAPPPGDGPGLRRRRGAGIRGAFPGRRAGLEQQGMHPRRQALRRGDDRRVMRLQALHQAKLRRLGPHGAGLGRRGHQEAGDRRRHLGGDRGDDSEPPLRQPVRASGRPIAKSPAATACRASSSVPVRQTFTPVRVAWPSRTPRQSRRQISVVRPQLAQPAHAFILIFLTGRILPDFGANWPLRRAEGTRSMPGTTPLLDRRRNAMPFSPVFPSAA